MATGREKRRRKNTSVTSSPPISRFPALKLRLCHQGGSLSEFFFFFLCFWAAEFSQSELARQKWRESFHGFFFFLGKQGNCLSAEETYPLKYAALRKSQPGISNLCVCFSVSGTPRVANFRPQTCCKFGEKTNCWSVIKLQQIKAEAILFFFFGFFLPRCFSQDPKNNDLIITR